MADETAAKQSRTTTFQDGAGARWCSFQDGAGSIIPSQTYRLSKYSVFYYVRAMSTGFKIVKSSLSFFRRTKLHISNCTFYKS